MAKEEEKQAAQAIYELGFYRQQAEDLQRQLQAFQSMIAENEAALIALKNLPSTKEPTLQSIGAGVFLQTNLGDDKKVFTEVGAGVMTEKTVSDAIALLEERQQKLEHGMREVQEAFVNVTKRIEFLNSRLQELQQR